MALSRANPSGWSQGDLFTSAQANAIDINVANALDKSLSGDTLSGPIVVAPTGSVTLNSADGIIANAAFAVLANTANAVGSVTPGGIICAGGPTDFVGLSSRSRVVRTSLLPFGNGSDGSNWSASAVGGGTGSPPTPAITSLASSGVGLMLWMPVHNGATLTTVKMWLQVGNIHANVPAVFPGFDVRRVPISSFAGTTQSLFSGGAAFATAASGGAWFNSGNIQSWQGTCNQNNVIDTTTYGYYVALYDENGANSHPANAFYGMELTFSAITTMAFP